uniref:Ig-like domain-containing protein n=1 Tax=Megaselia scalaris TaxID=36166 RepID=T1GLC7_MEGSC
MKTGSNIIKKERKHLIMDDSQPLPELELITQRRVQEGVDKVPEEEVIEDSVIQETTDQTISEIAELEEQLVKVTEKKEIKPPKFVKKLKPKKVTPKTTTVLECKVEGVPTPEIKWFFNDVELFATEQYEITVSETVTKLYIKNVTPKEVGLYTCEARNEAGVATTRANIVLETEQGIAPTFTKPLKIEFTQVEDDKTKAIVTCQVSGSPKPSVKWFKGVEQVVPTEAIQSLYDEETGEAVLEVYNPQVNEPLVFSIQAENPFGKAVGNANILREIQEPEETREILKPPKVTPLSAEVIRNGGTLVFESKINLIYIF